MESESKKKGRGSCLEQSESNCIIKVKDMYGDIQMDSGKKDAG